ncbi:hypothetical protein [Stappia sp. ES.058]|uniref:hypothetical protein n=1 Tax=Stappia sp. ES.058 TaxID=1881061 RepID=UPI0012FE3BBC|nr:hypothetical protein [Stappia sp. ES.058]
MRQRAINFTRIDCNILFKTIIFINIFVFAIYLFVDEVKSSNTLINENSLRDQLKFDIENVFGRRGVVDISIEECIVNVRVNNNFCPLPETVRQYSYRINLNEFDRIFIDNGHMPLGKVMANFIFKDEIAGKLDSVNFSDLMNKRILDSISVNSRIIIERCDGQIYHQVNRSGFEFSLSMKGADHFEESINFYKSAMCDREKHEKRER